MAILGEGFDGDWYAGTFDDYFITQWGPERQDVGEGEYWGVVVNNVFTIVGGCQYQSTAATRCCGSTTPSTADPGSSSIRATTRGAACR